jgi:hypothetical protein
MVFTCIHIRHFIEFKPHDQTEPQSPLDTYGSAELFVPDLTLLQEVQTVPSSALANLKTTVVPSPFDISIAS